FHRHGRTHEGSMRRAFSPAQDIVLRHLWEEGVDPDVIATRLEHPLNSIYARAKELGLSNRGRPRKPPEPKGKRTRAQLQNAHWRKISALRHRQALGLPDPIITRPCEAMFG